MSIELMHKTLNNLFKNKHEECGCFCPECGSELKYSYFEERLYHVICNNCDTIEALVYGSNIDSACMKAGGLLYEPSHFILVDDGNKLLCSNCNTDLMGYLSEYEVDVIQCPDCGERLSKVVEVEDD